MPFVLNEDGSLTLIKALDRETTDTYSLVVRITDRGTDPKALTTTKTIKVQGMICFIQREEGKMYHFHFQLNHLIFNPLIRKPTSTYRLFRAFCLS